jgi:hypothetical protein
MTLPAFLFIEPQADIKGAGFLLSTEHPYTFLKIWTFKDDNDFASHAEKYADYAFVDIDGYNIGLSFIQCLDASLRLKPERIYNSLFAGAKYYFAAKIQPNLGYYKRYLKGRG